MVLSLTIIAVVFTFYVPFYLKNKAGEIKPTKNIFEEFVENDHGYPWSTDEERISSYQKALKEKTNSGWFVLKDIVSSLNSDIKSSFITTINIDDT